jgi:uncharacterized protein
MKKASSELLLLDLNCLVALAWPTHQFHGAAVRRLERVRGQWATCALTQLGFIRLSSNPTVVGVRKNPAEATALLCALVDDPQHLYLESLPSPAREPAARAFQGILGTQQVNDAYLTALAERYGATLLTFDIRIRAMVGSRGKAVIRP